MDNPWLVRPRPRRRGVLTILAIALALISLVWAAFVLEMVFYNSDGSFRSPAFINIIVPGLVALAPLFGCGIMVYKDWVKSRPRK